MKQEIQVDIAIEDNEISASYSASGKHCLADFFECSHLDDLDFIEQALTLAAKTSGATILETKFHKFGEGGGVTGVLLLAESHMSIHTWPEQGYAAIDIFMCGNCDVDGAIEKLKMCFKPQNASVQIHSRGSLI